jgi:hypothetical protein
MNCGSKNTNLMVFDIDGITIKSGTMICRDCDYTINFKEVKRE